jgi:hypothetical protein
MPEATVLYSVTAVVIAALVLWVAAVLKTAKEPWAREPPPKPLAQQAEPSSTAAPVRGEAEEPEGSLGKRDGTSIDADETAKATPMALGEQRAAATEASESEKPSEEKS